MERHGSMEFQTRPGERQFVKFTFFKVAPEWRRLDVIDRDAQIGEFADVVASWEGRNLIRCYSTMGTRGDVDFMIWQVSYELEDLQQMAGELLGTTLGGYLTTPHSYLSMTKHSAYVEKYAGPGQDRATRLSLAPGEHKYLFVYPLTKMREWYSLPAEERQAIMNQHIAVGASYSSVKLNTTYSFGIDDQEFTLAFETDVPGDFLDLVQELRASTSSAYTLSDIPIFTCIATTARGMLEALAVARGAVPA
ncbi:MAG: chlorite dismutase family protein [Thermomicrobiales bacterium]|nr:chlorite dismutase family protein [Thermomicrobiales bacterium]